MSLLEDCIQAGKHVLAKNPMSWILLMVNVSLH